MDLNMSFHIKMREERKKKRLTQKEISEKIGISRSYYSDIENGRTLPSSKVLFKINSVIPIFFTISDADRDHKKEAI